MVALGTIPVKGVGLLVILTVGGVVAALSQSTKSVARFVSTLASAGFLTVVPSLIENVLVLIVVLLPLCFYRHAHSAGTLRPRARLTLHSYREHLDQQTLADITPAQVATNLSQLG
jgi:Domain of unknown function (DUF4126)